MVAAARQVDDRAGLLTSSGPRKTVSTPKARFRSARSRWIRSALSECASQSRPRGEEEIEVELRRRARDRGRGSPGRTGSSPASCSWPATRSCSGPSRRSRCTSARGLRRHGLRGGSPGSTRSRARVRRRRSRRRRTAAQLLLAGGGRVGGSPLMRRAGRSTPRGRARPRGGRASGDEQLDPGSVHERLGGNAGDDALEPTGLDGKSGEATEASPASSPAGSTTPSRRSRRRPARPGGRSSAGRVDQQQARRGPPDRHGPRPGPPGRRESRVEPGSGDAHRTLSYLKHGASLPQGHRTVSRPRDPRGRPRRRAGGTGRRRPATSPRRRRIRAPGEYRDEVRWPLGPPSAARGAPSTGAESPSKRKPASRCSGWSASSRSRAGFPRSRPCPFGRPSPCRAWRASSRSRCPGRRERGPFEAEHAQSLQAMREKAEVVTALEQRVPEADVARMVKLEAELPGEAESERHAVDAGDSNASMVEVGERVVRQLVVRQAREELARLGARDVDRGARVRHVRDPDLVLPRLGPVAKPRLGLPRSTGREREIPAAVLDRADRSVVDHVARLVEQEAVTELSPLEVGDSIGIQTPRNSVASLPATRACRASPRP